MARGLAAQVREFRGVMSDLVKRYQFRDRGETVAYGLSVSQAYALSALARRGPLAMGALAADLGLSVSTLTRTVDALVARSLVRRIPDPEDRRVLRVELTPRGRKLWGQLEAELLAIDADVLRSLSPREREAVIRAMKLLAAATDAWREEKAQLQA
jgi:DNA-binding MarR family transcriptional regulator